jgi:outer membrane immunogenic protein
MITPTASPARNNRLRLTHELHLACIAGGVLAAIVAISPAPAADMSMPTKAPPAPAYNWTGCYVGANLGGGASGTNFRSTVDPGTYLGPADAATVSADGSGSRNDVDALGGGQLGCNWQTGTFVLGIEGDYDYFRSNPNINNNTGATGVSLANGSPFGITQSLTTNFLATVRPRVGIAADRNFAYITGGVAFTTINYTETYSDTNPAPGPGAGTASASKDLIGWTAGAGWEYAFADHWTVRAEYLIAGFSTTNALGTIVAPGGTNTLHGSADLLIQLVRTGVNFKF